MKKRYAYRIFKRYVRFFMDHLLFRRHYVLGKENMPKQGDHCIIPANHQHPAIDPVSTVLCFPQPVHPYILAFGTIFTWNDWINKFWDWVGMLPAFRMDYEGVEEALKRTKWVVDVASTKMVEGYPVMLFPEANHHEESFQRQWTQGFLEIAFTTAEKLGYEQDVKVVPLGLHFSQFYGIQGEYIHNFGEPFSLKPYYEQYKQKPRTTVRQLTPVLREQLKKLMLCTEDMEHHDLYDFLRRTNSEEAFAKELGLNINKLPERLECDQKFWAALEDGLANKADGPKVVEELDATWREIRAEEKKLRLREHAAEKKRMSVPAIIGSALVQLALLPLWLVSLFPGAIFYFVPPTLMPGKEDRYYRIYTVTMQFCITLLVLLPLCALATLLVLGLVWGWWWQAVVWIVLWYPMMLFAWYEGLWMRRTKEQITLRCHKKDALKLLALYKKLYNLVDKLIGK